MHDPLNAFCAHAAARLQGAPAGPLAGLTLPPRICLTLRATSPARATRIGSRRMRRPSAPRPCAGAGRRRRDHGGKDPYRRALARHFRRERPLRHSDQSRRRRDACRAAPRAARRRRWRAPCRFRARHRYRRIRAHPRQASAASLASGRRTDASRSTAWSVRRRASTRSAGSRAMRDLLARIGEVLLASGCWARAAAAARRSLQPMLSRSPSRRPPPRSFTAAERIAAMIGGSEKRPLSRACRSPTGSRISARCRAARRGRRSAIGSIDIIHASASRSPTIFCAACASTMQRWRPARDSRWRVGRSSLRRSQPIPSFAADRALSCAAAWSAPLGHVGAAHRDQHAHDHLRHAGRAAAEPAARCGGRSSGRAVHHGAAGRRRDAARLRARLPVI